MEELTVESIRGIPQNGPTDPIEYYRWPFVGALFRERINRGLRLLPPRPFTRGLEIGYGSGGLLAALSRGVAELHGIDLDSDPEVVDRILAARGCRANLRQGSVYELPYDSSTFDLVVCFSVFEHLHKPELALAEVRRVLSPGGLFLLGMPAVNPAMTVLFRLIGHNTINDIHVTTPKTMVSAFAAAGLRLTVSSCLGLPAAPPWGFPLYHEWLLDKPLPPSAAPPVAPSV
jgi:2-polyprenyl-3-methyl-5-hydroxy-6-metoxy-1,4-benzoquinol methylase